MRVRKDWQALEPWKPFFWYGRLPSGVYLRSERQPVLLPAGWLVDEKVFFAIRLRLDVEKSLLMLHRYGFLTDPGAHTNRVVRRGGYWCFDVMVASSASESIDLLRTLMQSLEILALERDARQTCDDAPLESVVAWEERMASPPPARWEF